MAIFTGTEGRTRPGGRQIRIEIMKI